MGYVMINGWTEDRVTLLKKLWTDGLSASQIAKQLGGVTRNAVIGKVHRLGLAGRAAPSSPIKRVATPIARVKPVLVVGSPAREVDVAAVQAALSLPKTTHVAAPLIEGDVAVPVKTVKLKPKPIRNGEIIGVLQLGPNMCKWPIGDPGDADFGFCGGQTPSAAVYCEEHAAIAFQPAMSRRPGATRDDRVASEARRLARLANF
jgi:GcrA cell cycle regulator